MNTVFDDRWIGNHGIGRYAMEVSTRCNFEPLCVSGKPLTLLDPIKIRNKLLRKKPTHFFSPGYNPPLGRPCSFSFTIHDLMLLDLPQLRSTAKTGYFEYIVKPGIRNADLVFTGSEYSHRRIVEWSGVSPEKVIAVGYGVGDNYTSAGLPWKHARPYLLYVGNQRAHKNVEMLIDAYARSSAKENYDLLLSGNFSENVLSRVHANKLQDQVHALGMVPEVDLPSLYRGAHALVMPSKYEGFGLPLIEAMACGTPVLASNATAIPEACGDAALYFDPGRIDSMVDALDQLSDEGLLAQLRSTGLMRAKDFRWEHVAGRIQSAIATIA